jgi:hypothetical protein
MHLGLVLAEVLLGPAVHAGDAGLSVEVDHGCASAPRLRDLVDLAGGVALLVAVQTVTAQILLPCVRTLFDIR